MAKNMTVYSIPIPIFDRVTLKNNLKTYSDTLYNVDLNMQRIYIANTVGFGGHNEDD